MKKEQEQSKNIFCEKSGLVQVAYPLIPGFYQIAYLPDRTTLCLGGFTTAPVADVYESGEYIVIRFNNGNPSEVILNKKEAEERELKDNEVKIKVGDYFIVPLNFSNPKFKKK